MGKKQKIILCDTNIFIHLVNGTDHVITEFRHIGNENVAVNPVITAELFRGCDNKEELRQTRLALRKHHLYHTDTETSKKFVSLVGQYALSHRIAIPDALIAATALANGLELYTLNRDDFKFIEGLKLYKPKTY